MIGREPQYTDHIGVVIGPTYPPKLCGGIFTFSPSLTTDYFTALRLVAWPLNETEA